MKIKTLTLIIFILNVFFAGCTGKTYEVYHLKGLDIVVTSDQDFLNSVCNASEGYICEGCWKRSHNTIYTKPKFDVLIHELLHFSGYHHYGKLDFDYDALEKMGIIEKRRWK